MSARQILRTCGAGAGATAAADLALLGTRLAGRADVVDADARGLVAAVVPSGPENQNGQR